MLQADKIARKRTFTTRGPTAPKNKPNRTKGREAIGRRPVVQKAESNPPFKPAETLPLELTQKGVQREPKATVAQSSESDRKPSGQVQHVAKANRRTSNSSMFPIVNAESPEDERKRLEKECLDFFTNPSRSQLLDPSESINVRYTDVESIFNSVRAPVDIMVYLRALNQGNKRFQSFDDLVDHLDAVSDTVKGMMNAQVSPQERQEVAQYLSSPECNLFREVEYVQATQPELTRLVLEGRGVHGTLQHLQKLNNAGRSFHSFEELIFSVVASELAQATFEEIKKDVLVYLHSPACKLFSQALEDVISTSDQVARLVQEAGAGGDTLSHLKKLDSDEVKFSSFDKLAPAVKNLHHQLLKQRQVCYLTDLSPVSELHRKEILNFLTNPYCKLIRGNIRLTESSPEFDAMLAAGKTLPATLNYLRAFNNAGHRFNSAEQITTAIKNGYADLTKQILNYLTNQAATPCWLFSGRDDNGAGLHHTIEGVDRMLTESRVGPEAIKYLQKFDSEDRTFNDLFDLTAALKVHHVDTLKKRTDDKIAVVKYLASTDNSLLPDGVLLSDKDIFNLFEAGGDDTMMYLEYCETKSRTFSAVQPLLKAVHTLNQGAISAKADILAHLNSSKCQLFSHQLEDDESFEVTPEEVDRLWCEGGAGPDTLLHIWSFDIKGLKFPEFGDLVIALKAAYKASLNQRRSERKFLAAFFFSPKCRLFQDPIQLTNRLLDDIINASSSGTKTLYHIRKFNDERRQFQRFGDLVSAVQAAHLKAENTKQKALAYLQGPGSRLMPDRVVAADDLDRLYMEGSAGPLLLLYLKHLNGEGMDANLTKAWKPSKGFSISFSSFSELNSAITALHSAWTHSSTKLLGHFVGPDCTLFSQAPQIASKLPNHSFQVHDVQRLMVEGGTGTDSLLHVLKFERQGLKFDSIDSLIERLREEQERIIEDRQVEKRSLVAILSKHSIFAPGSEGLKAAQTEQGLSLIFTYGGKDTLIYIEELDKSATSTAEPACSNLDELLEKLSASNKRAQERKKEIVEFLESDWCKYSSSVGKISEQDIDTLYRTAGLHTLSLLWKFSQTERTFQSVEDLLNACRNAPDDYNRELERTELDILAYLKGPESNLLPKAVLIQRQMVANMIQGNSSPSILLFLRELDSKKTRFRTVAELSATVMGTYVGMTPEKQAELLEFLREEGKVVLTGAASANPLHIKHVERLVTEGASGVHTVEYIKRLIEKNRTFKDLEELVCELRSLHAVTVRDQHEMIVSSQEWLNKCSLFVEPSLAAELQYKDVAGLYARAACGKYFEGYLKGFSRRGDKFSSLEDLLVAIKSHFQETSKQKSELMQHFRHDRSRLFSEAPFRVHVTMDDVDRLLKEGEAGADTLLHLWAFEANHRRFESINECIKAVKAAQMDVVDSVNGQIKQILQFLSSAECELFLNAVQTTEQELMHLVACNRDPGALAQLRQLNRNKMRFRTFENLIKAVQQADEDTITTKKEIYQQLSEYSVSTADTNRLFKESTAGLDTLVHIKKLKALGKLDGLKNGSITLGDVILEVKKMHYVCHEEQGELLRYLVSDSTLLNMPPEDLQMVNLQDLKHLLADLNISNKEAICIFEEIKREGKKYDRLDSLRPVLETAANSLIEVKQNILNYLHSPRCQLFAELPAEEKEWTAMHVDKLVDQSLAGSETLMHLWGLDAAGKKCGSFDELIDEVRISHNITHGYSYEEKLQAFTRMSMNTDIAAAYAVEPRKLTQKKSSATEKEGNNVAALTLAVETAFKDIAAQKEELLQYLKSPAADVLWVDATSSDAKLSQTSEGANRLYCEGKAEVDTIDNLKALVAKGKAFETLDELILALQKAVENKQRLSEALEITQQLDEQEKENERNPVQISDNDKKGVLDWLAGAGASIFARAVQLSDRDLVRIIQSSNGVENTLRHLKVLKSQGVRVNFGPELLETVRREHRRKVALKKDLLVHFYLPGSVFTNEKVGLEDVEALLAATQDDGNVINIVRAFSTLGKTFERFDEVVFNVKMQADLARSIMSDTTIIREISRVSKPDIDRVTAFLRSHKCNFFNHTKEGVPCTDDDIARLIIQGRSARTTLIYLHYFEANNLKFDSLPDLLAAVQQQRLKSPEEKKHILEVLKGQNSRIFSDVSASNLTPADASRLYEESLAGPATITFIVGLNAAGKRFRNLEELIIAVRYTYLNGPAEEMAMHSDIIVPKTASQIETEKRMLFHHLTQPSCKLLKESTDLRETDPILLKMVEYGPIVSTLSSLEALQTGDRQFESMALLFRAVKTEIELSGGRRSSNPQTSEDLTMLVDQLAAAKLFRESTAVSVQDAQSLLETGESLEAILDTISYFRDTGRTFGSTAELASAVVGEESRRVVLNYLSSTSCKLFADVASVAVTDSAMGTLIHVAAGAHAAVSFLERLDAIPRQFDTFEELIEAVKTLRASSAFAVQLALYLSLCFRIVCRHKICLVVDFVLVS